ncbi:Protein of unknown function [Cotesia congregata]|uniref:Uncharacterized protein n=1 Tax=Cotesia congregata TaxID=51543 RepID=A0A8J2H8P5_COTCN|nr:Protein of unknown function [Cotesia congregata]
MITWTQKLRRRLEPSANPTQEDTRPRRQPCRLLKRKKNYITQCNDVKQSDIGNTSAITTAIPTRIVLALNGTFPTVDRSSNRPMHSSPTSPDVIMRWLVVYTRYTLQDTRYNSQLTTHNSQLTTGRLRPEARLGIEDRGSRIKMASQATWYKYKYNILKWLIT